MQSGQAQKVPFMLRVFRFYFSKIGRLFPRQATKMAARLWIQPPPRKLKQKDFFFLDSSNSQKKSSAHHPYTMYTYGNGDKKALFVHAWGGHTADFKEIIPLYTKLGYQSFAFDFPGHGFSEPNDTDFHKLSLMLLEIDQEYGPFDLITTHSGGAIITYVALSRGLRLPKKMITISPLGRLYEHFQHKFVDLLHMPQKVSDRLEDYFKKEYGSEDFWNIYNINQYANEMNIPGLIIHDKDDTGVPVSESEILHQNWSNSELMLTEKLGHWRLLKDENILARIEEFVERDIEKAEQKVA